MSYRVVWRQRVRQRLDVLAFLARERGDTLGRVERAIAEIELRVALAPNQEGESSDGNERVLVVRPLTVWYDVFEQAQVVLIYQARYHYGRRS